MVATKRELSNVVQPIFRPNGQTFFLENVIMAKGKSGVQGEETTAKVATVEELFAKSKKGESLNDSEFATVLLEFVSDSEGNSKREGGKPKMAEELGLKAASVGQRASDIRTRMKKKSITIGRFPRTGDSPRVAVDDDALSAHINGLNK
jgi:hypothetical protein